MYDMPPLNDCHHPSVRPSVRPSHPTVRPSYPSVHPSVLSVRHIRPSVRHIRQFVRPVRPSDRPIMMPPPLSAAPMESPGCAVCLQLHVEAVWWRAALPIPGRGGLRRGMLIC